MCTFCANIFQNAHRLWASHQMTPSKQGSSGMPHCDSIFIGSSRRITCDPDGRCVWSARAPVQILPFALRTFVQVDRLE